MQSLRESRVLDGQPLAVLFHSPSFEKLAEEIRNISPNNFKKGEISWAKFEDGFPNLFIKDIEAVRGRDCVILASFLDPKEMLSQLSILYSLPRYAVRSLIVILPYFPTGTMERVDEEGQIATAFTFARLLSNIPPTISGPAKLMIYDIHALQERFYFTDGVLPLLVSAIPQFINALKTKHSEEKIAIAFPDEGATKRFGKYFSKAGYPVITCTKIRDGNKRVIHIREGAEYINDYHIFMVDDLVKTGGTLIECRNALYEKGCKQVSAYVTHPVFPDESWKRFLLTNDTKTPFLTFYVTDSCPEISSVLEGKKPFEVISLARSIADNVLKY